MARRPHLRGQEPRDGRLQRRRGHRLPDLGRSWVHRGPVHGRRWGCPRDRAPRCVSGSEFQGDPGDPGRSIVGVRRRPRATPVARGHRLQRDRWPFGFGRALGGRPNGGWEPDVRVRGFPGRSVTLPIFRALVFVKILDAVPDTDYYGAYSHAVTPPVSCRYRVATSREELRTA